MAKAVRLSGFKPDACVQALGPDISVYVVGGAVRDELLGLQATDRDWVVVGARPETLLAAGFEPVGADFPVFLHPVTHEEYALARTERKTAAGYKGFTFHAAPDVTLAQDLQRRDLTVNAMAMDADGQLHDPWGGYADLKARVLRHVSSAFAEDPVRILRLARFAARFPDCSVAPDTMKFCTEMVTSGETRALVPERVWQEVSRLLMSAAPEAGWSVLRDCGALPDLLDVAALPYLSAPSSLAFFRDPTPMAGSLPMRWAAWLLYAGCSDGAAQAQASRWRVPSECAELAGLAVRLAGAWVQASDAATVGAVLAAADLYRRPERFAQWLTVVAQVSARHCQSPVWPDSVWQAAAAAARALPVGDIARAAQASGQAVPVAVAQAREAAIGQVLARQVK